MTGPDLSSAPYYCITPLFLHVLIHTKIHTDRMMLDWVHPQSARSHFLGQLVPGNGNIQNQKKKVLAATNNEIRVNINLN